MEQETERGIGAASADTQSVSRTVMVERELHQRKLSLRSYSHLS